MTADQLLAVKRNGATLVPSIEVVAQTILDTLESRSGESGGGSGGSGDSFNGVIKDLTVQNKSEFNTNKKGNKLATADNTFYGTTNFNDQTTFNKATNFNDQTTFNGDTTFNNPVTFNQDITAKTINTENLNVSQTAQFVTLAIQKMEAAGGIAIYSPGYGIVDSVTGNTITIKEDDDISGVSTLSSDDYIIHFKCKPNAVSEDGNITVQEYWQAKIKNITGNTITISEHSGAEIKKDHKFIVFGNSGNKSDRQKALIICAHNLLNGGAKLFLPNDSSIEAPYILYLKDIKNPKDFKLDSYWASNKTLLNTEFKLTNEDKSSIIEATKNEIKLDSDFIKLVAGEVNISSNNIHLEGYTSINDQFQVDRWGNLIQGIDVWNRTSYMVEGSNNILLSGQGRTNNIVNVYLPNDPEFIGRRITILVDQSYNNSNQAIDTIINFHSLILSRGVYINSLDREYLNDSTVFNNLNYSILNFEDSYVGKWGSIELEGVPVANNNLIRFDAVINPKYSEDTQVILRPARDSDSLTPSTTTYNYPYSYSRPLKLITDDNKSVSGNTIKSYFQLYTLQDEKVEEIKYADNTLSAYKLNDYLYDDNTSLIAYNVADLLTSENNFTRKRYNKYMSTIHYADQSKPLQGVYQVQYLCKWMPLNATLTKQ